MTLAASPRISGTLVLPLPHDESSGRGEALSSRPGSTERSPRLEPDPSLARLRLDRFEPDEADARLTCAGEPVALAPKPFAVLCTLARSPRRLVTKNALLDAVWGHRFVARPGLQGGVSERRGGAR